MDNSAIAVNNQATSRKIVQSNHTVPSAGQKDTYQQNVLLNGKAMSQLATDANFKREEGTKTVKRVGKNGNEHQPQYSHKNNRCLNCAGDHQTRDCPTRQQHQAPTTSNPASGTGIYQNHNQFSNTSPQHSSPSQQHCQQSQSTVGVTMPTLMVNNPPFQQGLQQQPPAPIPPVNQQTNYPVRPQQFNQQFTLPPLPQVSPLLTPPQPFNPQVPPYTFHNIHLLIALLRAVAILLFL